MPPNAPEQPDDLIGICDGARRLGVTPSTLRNRIRTGEVVLWMDPLDHRRRLVRARDLDALRRPRPATPEEVRPTAA